jgi:2-polyprenyl-3-methyl-5-hydroxy-6-metoxy-1,4-benzoquinol methylase
MAKYVWQHHIDGEADRLRLMSRLLDPSSRLYLLRTGVSSGWTCLEVGAGNGSLSQWLGQQVGPGGRVVATDLHPELMAAIAGPNVEVRALDVVHEEPPGGPFDLIVIRALLHHLPERRAVVSRLVSWLKPGGWIFVHEPDFYPASTVEPPTQRAFWNSFLRWAAKQEIDYFVGRKVPAWLQELGLQDVSAEGQVALYNGGSDFARWWELGLEEIADRLKSEGGVKNETLAEFFALARDPHYWTMTLAFTACLARKPA